MTTWRSVDRGIGKACRWRQEISRFNKALRVIIVAASLTAGCGSTSKPPVVAHSSGRCGHDFGKSPFKDSNATHLLIADFYGPAPASEQNFGDRVSTQVTEALRQFKEEELPKLDIQVPSGALEIQRLSCFLDSHEHADEAAKALKADVVIWGQAFCNAQVPVHVETKVGDIQAESGAHVKAGNVEIHAKPYTVCPKATLYRSERDYRRSERGVVDLASLGHLDLPALRATEPFRLVEFALGLHFFEIENYWLAARFFESSSAHMIYGEKDLFSLDVALGFTYAQDPNFSTQSLEHSRRALAVVAGSGKAIEAKLLNNIGSVLHAQGNYPGALGHLRQALAIYEKALGPEHPATAGCTNNIGSVLHAQGDYPGALGHLRQALAISEKVLGPEHRNTATYANNIGLTLHAQGDFERALIQFRKALVIAEKALGPDHPNIATYANGIGMAFHAQGDFEGAIVPLRRALIIAEKALGPDHPHTATFANNIGLTLHAQGDFAGARVQFQRALAIAEKLLGPDHPITATYANNIGWVLQAQGNYAGALVHLRRALAIAEKALGPEHPITRTVRVRLAGTLTQQSGWDPKGKKGGVVVVRCDTCNGLETGDWVKSYGKTKLRNGKHLSELVRTTAPSISIQLTLVRSEKSMKFTVPSGPLKIEVL